MSNFVFCHFCEKFENSKWPPFLEREQIFQNWAEYLAKVPLGPKISTKSLYLAPLRRYDQFCVLPLLRKIGKFKMAAIFGKRKTFSKWDRLSCKSSSGAKNFDEIALSRTVKEIWAILHFSEKSLKIQNGRHFFKNENLLKIGQSMLLKYPAGQKFRRNHSI